MVLGDNFKVDSPVLVLTFDGNVEIAQIFKDWLDGAGEQDFWNWLEYRREDGDTKVKHVSIDYSKGSLITCIPYDDEE